MDFFDSIYLFLIFFFEGGPKENHFVHDFRYYWQHINVKLVNSSIYDEFFTEKQMLNASIRMAS